MRVGFIPNCRQLYTKIQWRGSGKVRCNHGRLMLTVLMLMLVLMLMYARMVMSMAMEAVLGILVISRSVVVINVM